MVQQKGKKGKTGMKTHIENSTASQCASKYNDKLVIYNWEHKRPEPCFNIKNAFPRNGDSHLKIRRSQDRLIFNKGIPILVRRHLYIETAPRICKTGEKSLPGGQSVTHQHMGTYAWWRHGKETLSALLILCEGNPVVTGGSLHKGPVIWSPDVFLC